ncbi:hypothetical protein DUI87_26310 [Hirundo rustica rustica]|uniref:Peptidase A2 domain-containing protein n=1 Tax=Hirundo rustica rustica TaxID=333673 RepID=A0A3M0J8M4_HIRRU|nr:hypothetical protein DUI87_26310 [Hirundo rustica rustica]
MSAALPRPQGDPLTGLTMDELMGQGPFHRIEAQRRLCPVRIGKLQNQREVGPRQDTSSSSCSADNQLVPATSGSLGLDLAAAVTVTLFNNSPHVVSTGVFGPIIVNGQPTGGLILGRSSGSVLGLFIEPGVVDADSEGEIFVIASTPHPPMKILKGQRIAQFVPLPQLTANILPRSKEPRGTGCLGSSGAITLPVIDLSTRPKRTCHLHYQGQTATLHKALLDTGADTCIVDLTKYPKMWPLLSSNTTVSGIGGIRLAQRSPLLTVEVDDKLAKAVFSLTPLPAEVDCILGRDVLTQLGRYLVMFEADHKGLRDILKEKVLTTKFEKSLDIPSGKNLFIDLIERISRELNLTECWICGGLHGQSEEMSNSSSISHFLLLALADTRQLQLLHFCLFLGISLAALLGNGLIISTVACGHLLHTPMFFFLLNLALTDLGSILTTVPKAMHNSLWDTRNISYTGCAAQLFFFLFFISAEFSLLTIMSYDRYVSICKPLHYGTLLGSRACAHMAAAAWASAFLTALLFTANTFSLPLCHGNALGQFFCEIPPILKLSCSNSYFREVGVIVTAVFAYLKPPSISSPSLDLALSVLYSVVPPVLNPLIYSLRNQELKAAVWRLMTGWFPETLNCWPISENHL